MTSLQRWSELPDETLLRPVPDEPDACDVLVRDGPLVWVFHFTRILPEYSKLHANVGLEWTPTDGSLPQAYDIPRAAFRPLHTDFRSGSSKESLERRIRGYFDPAKKSGVPWTRLIEFAAGRLDEFLMSAGDLESATWIESREALIADYYIRPLWPEAKRPVVWYGQGEAGKGVMAIAASFALCQGFSFCGLRTKRLDRGLIYVDYEDSYKEFNVRMNRFANGLYMPPVPTLRRFDPRGRLFIDIVHALKAKVDSLGGCDGYVIDSAIPACGGDVLKPEPVGAFFSALSLLNRPAIVIAHETKEGPTSADSPFGSQLWRTLSCMTVNFAGSSEPRRDDAGNYVRDLILRCTKANGVPRFGPLAFELSFTDDDAIRSPALDLMPESNAAVWTKVRQINPTEVSLDLTGKLSPSQQLIIALRDTDDADGGATIHDLATATGLAAKTVENVLRRSDAFWRDGGGRGRNNAARWHLRGTSNGNHP